MSYHFDKLDNGLWALRDFSVFATCERNGQKYDTSFLLDDIEEANAEERNSGYKAPVFVRHTDANTGLHKTEEAVARMGNRRLVKVKVGAETRPGMVVDLFGLDDDLKSAIERGRLGARSVEIKKREGKRRISGLALLGSTTPYHKLKAGSEFENLVNFSDNDDATTVTTTFGDSMIENMPALEGDLHGALAQMMEVLHEIRDHMKGKEEKPEEDEEDEEKSEVEEEEVEVEEEEVEVEEERDNKYSEAAPETTEKLAEQGDDSLLVDLLSERAQLEAQLANLKAQQQVVEEKSETDLFLEGLVSQGFAVDVEREVAVIGKIGLDKWKLAVQPHLGRAPLEGQPAMFSSVAPTLRLSEDEDLKKYAEWDETARERASTAAAEWDDNAQQGYELTSAGRTAYIDFRVTRDQSEE